jgi:hypothetical protein
LIRIDPLVASISPVSILKVVLLPAPLVPNRQKMSPWLIPKETPLTANLSKLSESEQKQL